MTQRLVDRYRGMVRRHPVGTTCVGGLVVHVIVVGVMRSKMAHEFAYLSAVALSVVLIDLLVTQRVPSAAPLPVRRPLREIGVLGVVFVLACGWLIVRFEGAFPPYAPLVRGAFLVLGLGSVFNITSAVAFFALGYTPRDLGVRACGFAPVLPVIVTFAALMFLFTPESLAWRRLAAETGSMAGLALIALSAAVPEEFFRTLWQTRVAASWGRNTAAGWLVATLLWAALHLPKEYADSHSLVAALNGAVHIVPLGLLWGYFTIRARSCVPAVILHGTNVWGLQNLP